MAGQLTIDTLKASGGVLATQNGMTGIAKAWVNFQGGNGSTAGTINGSFNVGSITVNGTGDFTINFSTAMANTGYAVSALIQYTTSGGSSVGGAISQIPNQANCLQTGSVRVASGAGTSAGYYNCFQMCVIVCGS